MQDPESYLSRDIEFRCPVDKGKVAILDAEHRAFVNHEIYYFSGPDQLRTFLADPPGFCGMLTDPISRDRFQPDETSPRFDYMDRPYYFVSEENLKAFQARPDSFAVPNLKMIPKYKIG